MKFKKGDRVIAKMDAGQFVKKGETYIVSKENPAFISLVGFPALQYNPCIFDLAPVEKAKPRKKEYEVITISTDGNGAKARHIKGGKLLNEVKLQRYEKDSHNMKQLAAYAVQKLLPKDGNLITVVKSGYTGAVCVTASKNDNYKPGRILEFVGGKCTNPPSRMSTITVYQFDSFAELKAYTNTIAAPFDVIELHRN